MNAKRELRRHKAKLGGWDSGRLGDYHDKKVELETVIMILEEEQS